MYLLPLPLKMEYKKIKYFLISNSIKRSNYTPMVINNGYPYFQNIEKSKLNFRIELLDGMLKKW